MITTLGFIGTGSMGSALLRGMISLGGLKFAAFDLDDRSLEVAQDIGAHPCSSASELIKVSDYIFLNLKPNQVRSFIRDEKAMFSKNKCLISIAAGVTTTSLTNWLDSICPVIRVLPNTPALVGAGLFALCLEDKKLSEQQKAFICNLFENIGQVFILEERYFDAFTALAGSGPAYVYYFMDALIEAAVAVGFNRSLGSRIVRGLFNGSVSLIQETNQHPVLLREEVTSPGGVTAEALRHFDRKAIRGTIVDAIDKAFKRSKELGE